MEIDQKLLLEILDIHKFNKLDFVLHLNNKKYQLQNVIITKSSTPVTRPTTRGGAYFSDTYEFKMKATTNDFSIIPLLSKSMLGPSTEFQDLEIRTMVPIENRWKNVTLFTNLTNNVQSSSQLELNMNIVRTNMK